jgi:hypothetical protein
MHAPNRRLHVCMLLPVSRTGPRPPRCVVSPRPCTCRYGPTYATPPSERPVCCSHAHALTIVCMFGECRPSSARLAPCTLRQSPLLEQQLCACVLLLGQTTSWMCYMMQANRLLVQQLWLADVFALHVHDAEWQHNRLHSHTMHPCTVRGPSLGRGGA